MAKKPEIITVKITNWDKYQSSKTIEFFKMSVYFFDDPSVQNLTPTEKLYFIFMLTKAAQQRTDKPRFTAGSAKVHCRFNGGSEEVARSNLLKSGLIGPTDKIRKDKTTQEGNDMPDQSVKKKFLPKDVDHLLEQCSERVKGMWLEQWSEDHIRDQATKALRWCVAKETYRTKKGWQQFLNNWLSRDWNQERNQNPSSQKSGATWVGTYEEI